MKPAMEGQKTEMLNIKEIETEQTGGGVYCDVIHLEDGSVLVISQYEIGLYQSHGDWLEDRAVGRIDRP